MPRIIHGFHLTRKPKHRKTTFFFVLFIIAVIAGIGLYSGGSFATLAGALGTSLFRLVAAYLLSLFLAVLIAVSVSDNKIGDSLIPVFDLMQNLPSFALIPVFVLWFGYTNFMTIIFAATSILWPILFYMLHALKTVNKDKEDAAKIFGATGWKKMLYFSLPIAFPAAVTGSIVGFAMGWEAVIGVEIIGLTTGIGPFINSAAGSGGKAMILGLSALLLVVFLINRLVWMPLLKKSQLYAD